MATHNLWTILQNKSHSSEILPALQTTSSINDIQVYLTLLEALPDDEELAQERRDCQMLLTGQVPPSLKQVPMLTDVLPNDLQEDLIDCLSAPVVCPVELRQILSCFYKHQPMEWASVYPLLFYTRDPMGLNKRDVFKTFLKFLYGLDPVSTRAILPNIPVVGCWRDVYQLLRDPRVSVPLFQDLLDLVVQACRMAHRGDKVIEYAPRETKHRVLAGILSRALYPKEPLYSTRMKLYRNFLANLTPLPTKPKCTLNSAATPFSPQQKQFC